MEDLCLVRATLVEAILRLQGRQRALAPVERMKLTSMLTNLRALEACAGCNDNAPERRLVVRPAPTHLEAFDDSIGVLEATGYALLAKARWLRARLTREVARSQELRSAHRLVLVQSRQTRARSTYLLGEEGGAKRDEVNPAAMGPFDNNRIDLRCRTGPWLLFLAASLSVCCRTYL